MAKSLFSNTRHKRDLSKSFANEILFLKGKHENKCCRQSILFFTAWKCASGFIFQLLKRLVQGVGMTAINLEGYIFHSGKTEDEIYKKNIYRPNGYFYGPLYSMSNREIPDIGAYKIILSLRDPRDALTSFYFSMAYSYKAPLDNSKASEYILAKREKFIKQTIDEAVLDEAPAFLNIYAAYCQRLLNRPNVLFVKYENMVNEFSVWLDALMESLQMDVEQELLNAIKKEIDFKVPKEDIYSHKRQVMPGDHKRKLKQETISLLNSKFKGILEALGYPKD